MCKLNPFSFVANDFANEEIFYHCYHYYREFPNTQLQLNDKYKCLQSLGHTCLHGQSSYTEKIKVIIQFDIFISELLIFKTKKCLKCIEK